jgi:hypothetical protein
MTYCIQKDDSVWKNIYNTTYINYKFLFNKILINYKIVGFFCYIEPHTKKWKFLVEGWECSILSSVKAR